jgi:cell division transport system permease protein
VEEYAAGFTENPLAASANVIIYISDVSMQPALVTYLESLPEVRDVNRSDVVAEILSGVNTLIAYVSLGIIVILLVVSIFLISNTVAIGISVRREEINIMKYIGATDFFVRSPFVIEGILIGVVGSLIPLAMVYFIYEQLLSYVMETFTTLSELLTFLPVDTLFQTLIPVSMGMGAGIGLLGSIVTVKKHLRV